MAQQSELHGGQELALVLQRDPYLGQLLQRMIDGTNSLAKNTGSAVVGKVPPPPRIDKINVQGTLSGSTVTCPSEVLHWTLNHNQAISKNIRYFSEVDVTPSFTNPHIIDHGTSRTGIMTLPTYSSATNKTNNVPTSYYLRSYSQYSGSDASEATVHGGLGSPLKIQMTGSSVTALLASTGSGTASPTGQQGGQGLGTDINRPAPRAKRQSVKN